MADMEENSVLSERKFVDSILYQLHDQYDYPFYYVNEWFLKRKNVLLFGIEGEIYGWERILLGKDYNAFMILKELFDNLLKELLVPSLQSYYCSPVAQVCLTKRRIKNYKRGGYVIVLFKDAIFGRDQKIANGIEDRLSNHLAKNIRSLTGKGPKAVKTVLLDQKTAVHIIDGMISPYEQTVLINSSTPTAFGIGVLSSQVNLNLPFASATVEDNAKLAISIDNALRNSLREALILCYHNAMTQTLHIDIQIDAVKNQMCILVRGNNLIETTECC